MGKYYKCIEKAIGRPDTSIIKITDLNDTIEIPGINSCLGIICKLSDGSVVTGHAIHPFGATEGGDPVSIAQKIKNEYLGTATIVETICIGDSNYLTSNDPLAKESFEAVKDILGTQCTFLEKTTDYEDITVSSDMGTWQVTRKPR